MVGLYRPAELVYLQISGKAPELHMVKSSDLMKGKRGAIPKINVKSAAPANR